MKTCITCSRSLPVDEFHSDVRKEGRRRGRCRDCVKQYKAERRAQRKHLTPNEKACSRCKETLPASEFTKNSDSATGLHPHCKACDSEIRKNQPRYPRSKSVTEKCCTGCNLVLDASEFPSRSKNSDGLYSWCRACCRLRSVEQNYNITAEQYLEMAKNGCQMSGCGSFEKLHVDHDHSCCSGKTSCGKCVRGVLCERHNLGGGCFQDDPEELRAAVEYFSRGTHSNAFLASVGQTHKSPGPWAEALC